MGLIGVIIDMLSIVVYMPFLKVDEADISQNIRHLKKQEWFQSLLQHETARKFIIHDKEIRQQIGKFNSKRLHRQSYQLKCQKKLRKLIIKKQDTA